jgi:XTP/dITP diphosphohydrolase
MKVVLATGNRHKQKELSRIWPHTQILTPIDLGIRFDHDETGSTFFENALGKAQHLFELCDVPVVADDSGLCVDALGGAPGIYSARYGEDELGRPLEQGEKNALLLSRLDGSRDRSARFICSMVVVLGPHRFLSVQESFEGTIAYEAAGTGGFGYDPLFVPEGYETTVAELDDEVKDRISHRGKAASRLGTLLFSP